MAIKNYTSEVDVFKSLGEIQSSLAKHGAKRILIDYDDGGDPCAVSFTMDTPMGTQGFVLPAPVEGTKLAFQKGNIRADENQAKRTAWKNVRDWILAQMALIDSCSVPPDQIFLPFLADHTGETLYQIYSKGRLALAGKMEV